MATSAKLILDNRRKRDDGTYPLIIRIFHDRKSTSIPLEISIDEKDWDEREKQIKKSCKKFNDLAVVNNQIKRKITETNDLIVKLRDKKELSGMSVVQLKDALFHKSATMLFCQYATSLADSYEKMQKFGNAAVYKMAVSFIKKYNDGQDLPFSRLTYNFLKKIEVDYLSGKGSVNSLSVYFRTIRSIYNKAIKEGYAEEESYPFKHLVIRSEKTRKRAIGKDQIKKIEELDVPEGTTLWHTKNYFLFSFYCRGMNFIDLAKLQVKNINNDRITYVRSKSKEAKIFSVEITEKIQKILDTYMQFIDTHKPDSFIFPIVKRSEPKLQRLDIDNARGLFNQYLKTLAKECEITDNLTSYVARHSWASAAKRLRIPTEVISEGMGHSDVKTTAIYLEDFADEVLDEANKRITE